MDDDLVVIPGASSWEHHALDLGIPNVVEQHELDILELEQVNTSAFVG